jgi:hypothetical protein
MLLRLTLKGRWHIHKMGTAPDAKRQQPRRRSAGAGAVHRAWCAACCAVLCTALLCSVLYDSSCSWCV